MDLRVEAYRKHNNNNIYKVSLCMIKKDSIAYTDLSREENISNMEYENVGEIYVERCNIPIRYVKELRTGKLILLRKEILDNGNIVYIHPVSRPIFVREVINVTDNKRYFEHDKELKLVEDCLLNDEELAAYIDSLSEIKVCDVKKNFDNLFDEAENRYSEALSKNLVSNQGKTTNLVKKLKK